MENKFAFIQASMPLCESIEKGIADCVKLTKELKSKFILTYANYLFNYLSQFITPKFLSNLAVNSVS